MKRNDTWLFVCLNFIAVAGVAMGFSVGAQAQCGGGRGNIDHSHMGSYGSAGSGYVPPSGPTSSGQIGQGYPGRGNMGQSGAGGSGHMDSKKMGPGKSGTPNTDIDSQMDHSGHHTTQ
jgi:hypothetical protein